MRVKRSPRSPSIIDVAVGRNVRVWRIAKGMSQERLANQLGVTFQQVQKYESGANRMGPSRLVRVAAVLGVPTAVLFDGTEPSRPSLALVSNARSFRLAHAFAAIKDGTLRLSLVNLVERLAAAVSQSTRPRR